MKRNPTPKPLSLDELEDQLQWAHAHIAEVVRTRRQGARDPLSALELWAARELVRVELSLLAQAGDPAMVDRLARARATLTLIRGMGDSDRSAISLVTDALTLWSERAPGATDDVLARCAESSWEVLRWTAAGHLRVDDPRSAALLDALTRDASDSVKRLAIERLGARREVPWWKVAFTRDPLDGLSERKRRALAKPLALVREAYEAPPRFETDEEEQRRVKRATKRYRPALAALPDSVVSNHATAVLGTPGALHEQAPTLIEALGAREKSLDVLLALLERREHAAQPRALFERYFARFGERSKRDRVATLLQLTRWMHGRDRAQPDAAINVASHFMKWKKLWPSGASTRPWFELLLELGEQHTSGVLTDVRDALTTDAMPEAMRVALIERWSRGEKTKLFETISVEELAGKLGPRARWKLAQTILRERRSSAAMTWAMEQWLGPLYNAKRDGPRWALTERLCADVELRATVLTSHRLCVDCFEPLRALFNEGAIAGRDALGRFASTAISVSPDGTDWVTRWYFREERGMEPRSKVDPARASARKFARDERSLDALSAAEWERLRGLRRAALRREPLENARLDVDMFPLEDWDARDCEDFEALCEQVIEGGDAHELDVLACMAVHRWQPALHASGRALLAGIDEVDDLFDPIYWAKDLRKRVRSSSA